VLGELGKKREKRGAVSESIHYYHRPWTIEGGSEAAFIAGKHSIQHGQGKLLSLEQK